MRRRIWIPWLTCLAVAATGGSARPAPGAIGETMASVSRGVASGLAGRKLPLAFVRNDGQYAAHLRYTARGEGYAFGLTDHGLEVALSGSPAFSVKFRDADASPPITAESPLGGHASYFIGDDASRWRTGVPLFGRVRYGEVWPGIDIVFYGNQRKLEYDLVVAPGADPARARLTLEGADAARVTDDGALALRIGDRDLTFSMPVAYQQIERPPCHGGRGLRARRSDGVVRRRPVRSRTAARDRSDPPFLDLSWICGPGQY
jgi:hypothetical protein